jgi:hypothetical protein
MLTATIFSTNRPRCDVGNPCAQCHRCCCDITHVFGHCFHVDDVIGAYFDSFQIGDLPTEDVKPPDTVLFVCKLNPVTTDEDLEIIFSRFGKILRYEWRDAMLQNFHSRFEVFKALFLIGDCGVIFCPWALKCSMYDVWETHPRGGSVQHLGYLLVFNFLLWLQKIILFFSVVKLSRIRKLENHCSMGLLNLKR